MSERREISDYLDDILNAAAEVDEFIHGMDYETFATDKKTVNAVIRSLEVMGEATKHIPVAFRKKHPEIPWTKMAGMRDVLIHDYMGVDLRTVGCRRADGEPFIPRPRDLEVLRDSVKSQVRKMRDAVEHLDNDILDGKLPETATVGIHLGWKKASLGSLQLEYADIARWIEQLHELAAVLSRVHLVLRPVPEAPPSQ